MIVGYAVFKVSSSVVDDIVTTVEVPKSRITAFNASGVPISAQIIPTEEHITISCRKPKGAVEILKCFNSPVFMCGFV